MLSAIQFSITINAPVSAVWHAITTVEPYQKWANAFCAGSTFEGSWALGEKLRFLAPDSSGMVAVIVENVPFNVLSIKHLGYISDGVEDTTSAAVLAWAPALETYTFTHANGITNMQVDQEILPEYADYMTRAWPLALALLKEIAETSQ